MIISKRIISTSLSAVLIGGLLITSPITEAAVGCKKAGGIKCQSNASAKHKITHANKHRYHGRPVRGYKGWHYYKHPIVTALGVAIIVDAAGNYKTEQGNDVVILGNGDEITNVFEKDGKVYFIKS